MLFGGGKKRLQFIHIVNGGRLEIVKKIIKDNINHNNIDIQAMLLRLIFPFYDFCGF